MAPTLVVCVYNGGKKYNQVNVMKLDGLFARIKMVRLLNIFGGSLGTSMAMRMIQRQITHDMLSLRLTPADLNKMLNLPPYTITALASGNPDFFQVSYKQLQRLARMLDERLDAVH
ncbi:hypothetical protein LROSRS0_2141 [Furfurilactobacillus rossiae]|nr:hypothetical protein LROSRS0_2141 [Furfurilactobacillus rossiae]